MGWATFHIACLSATLARVYYLHVTNTLNPLRCVFCIHSPSTHILGEAYERKKNSRLKMGFRYVMFGNAL